eukprot:SAG31_NODE_578_length_13949_cov_5.041372_3_plen_49_part_00
MAKQLVKVKFTSKTEEAKFKSSLDYFKVSLQLNQSHAFEYSDSSCTDR